MKFISLSRSMPRLGCFGGAETQGNSGAEKPMLRKKDLLDSLYSCSPNAAVFSVLSSYGTDTDAEEIVDEDDVNLPNKLYQPCHCQLPMTSLSELVSATFNNLKVTKEKCKFLQQSTRNQSSSYIWHDFRRGLITSSHFHSVLHHSGKSYPKSLVNTIMQYTRPNPDLPSLKWGEYMKMMLGGNT